MKIVKAKGDDFSFRYDRETLIECTSKGTVVSDQIAATMEARFAVEVSEVPSDVKETVKVVEEAPVAETPMVDSLVEPSPAPSKKKK